MVHELAHQWFGDSVAPSRWGDIWQNEGHATWYEFQYAAEKGFLAEDTGIADLTDLMKAIYARSDLWRAAYGPPGAPTSGDVDELFNVNVYYGGALGPDRAPARPFRAVAAELFPKVDVKSSTLTSG